MTVPLAEQIAFLRGLVKITYSGPSFYHLSEDEIAAIAAALATLESVPAMLAVIGAAVVWSEAGERLTAAKGDKRLPANKAFSEAHVALHKVAKEYRALAPTPSPPQPVEAQQWRPITEEQRDGEIYLLSRGEPQLPIFVGYWDDRAQGWFSVAGAYAMKPEPIVYMPMSALPSPPQEGDPREAREVERHARHDAPQEGS